MEFDEAVRLAGYPNLDEYMRRFILPVVGAATLLFVLSLLGVSVYGSMYDLGSARMLAIFAPLGILMFAVIAVAAYPYYMIERVKVNIHENIHYFITYAGALSTIHIQRRKLFRLASQRIEYGEIAKVMEKVAYLSDYWNLGVVKTCRKLAGIVPSKILGNFLDRMSAAFDFGENLDTFLFAEQSAVMEDYASEYKQSLQTMSLVQDALVSLTIAVSFMMTVAFMLPLIMGYDIYTLVALSGLMLLFIDVMSLVFIDSFITHDQMMHGLPVKSPEYKRLKSLAAPVVALSLALLAFLLILQPLPWIPVLVAIALSPLAVIGWYASEMEAATARRDQAFPAFVRSLGGSMAAKGGSLVGTIGPLRIHEFGVLNEPVNSLYARLRVRCDKFQSWVYFAGETGSNLIEKFGNIFIQVVTLGGDPEKAAKMISDNFIKLLSLRDLRMQLAQSVRGVYYGTLVGIAGATYSTLRMVGILDSTFKKSFSSIAATPSVASMTAGIFPTIGDINMPMVENLLFVILVFHVAFSAYSVKMVDGGSKYTAFLDFVVMVWGVALTAVLVPSLFDMMFSQGSAASGVVEGVAPLP